MELPIFNTYYINFSRHHLCCFTIAPLFVLNKSTTWNMCCSSLQKFKFPPAGLPFGFANTFMISLHAHCTPMLPIALYCHE